MARTLTDVFGSNDFGVVELSKAIMKKPYAPTKIGKLGLFQAVGVSTRSIVIEEMFGRLALVPTIKPGGPPTPATDSQRKARSFTIPCQALHDVVLAESIQGVRKFGSANETEGIGDVIARKLASMRSSMEITEEYRKMGALRGILYDADGTTVIYNLPTEFQITQQTVAMALNNAATEVLVKCQTILQDIENGLGAGVAYDTPRAYCGAAFFQALTTHTTVKAAFANWQSNAMMREDVRGGFPFGGIMWEQYTGAVSGVTFLPTDSAVVFPLAVPEMYITLFAPADFNETANTIGQAFYAKQQIMDFDRGVELLVETNPLPLVTRPEAVIQCTRV